MQKIVIVIFTALALVLLVEAFGLGPRKQITDPDKMIKSKTGAAAFKRYAKSTYNDENVDFLKDSDKALKSWRKKTLVKRVAKLTDKYGKSSPREINLPGHLTLEKLQEPGLSKAHIKQSLQASRDNIKQLVAEDTLKNYKGTPEYDAYINRRN
jgi:hypothetical protein